LNEQKSYQFCYDRSSSHIFSPNGSALLQLRQNMEEGIVHVLPKLYRAVAARREDMTARTIIAKLVAFLFVQDSVSSTTKLHNVPVLLLGTG
jgi:hypothetical protein